MSKTTVMTEGSIWKQLVRFAIPLILGNLFQQMYNTVDSIIVGNYIGSDALAAVGSTGALINMLLAFCIGASTGAGIVIAQLYGAQDAKGMKTAVHTTLAISILSGALLTVIGVIISPWILKIMDTPQEIFVQSKLYLQIYFGGILFNVIYNFCAGILNAVGNSKKALQFLMIAAGSNVVLDWVFVVMLGMGVEGVALATDIAQLLSAFFIVRFMRKSTDMFRLKLKDIRMNWEMAGKIIRLGVPTGIQSMVTSLSNVVIQSSVNAFGPGLMAAFATYVKIDGFNFMPVMSFSNAATTFTGQNVGAGKYDRVKKGLRVGLMLGVGYTICTSVLLLSFGHHFVRIFVDDPEVIELGVYLLRFFCPFYCILATMHIFAGTLRGAGKTLPPMLIIIFALCVFRIIWINVTVPMFGEMKWIFMAYPISFVLGATAMILYTWKAKWLPKE